MRIIYETSNFVLTREIEGKMEGLDIFVLKEFDIAQRGGLGIGDYKTGIDGYGLNYNHAGRISNLLERLNPGMDNREKDEVLYELWLVISGIFNSFC